jgi:hypothetical protein
MTRIIISKHNFRKAIGRQRLPQSFKMFISGALLFDIIPRQYILTRLTYWVSVCSLDKDRVRLNWGQ